MDVVGPTLNNGNGNGNNVFEERLLLLETEVKFWRLKFEELEKWRASLDEWIRVTFGYNVRTNGQNTCSSGTCAAGNKSAGSLSDSRFSSPQNGWSPDSPDTMARSGHGQVAKAEASKLDLDYTDVDDDEKFYGINPGSVPKRKRGRPKKSALGNSMNNIPGVSSAQDSSQDAHDVAPWENSNRGGQIKRGRGRPRKIRINSDEMMAEGDQGNKLSGKKKPGTPTMKTCDICLLECESNQDLIAHKRAIHPERLYACNICHETYLHPGFLARHMETHTLDRSFKCHMCISSFNTYQLLKLHCAEKHGMDLGRQNDWKQGGDQGRPLDSPDYGSMSDRYNGQQQNPLSISPQAMMSAPSNCISGSDYVTSNGSHMSMSPMAQHPHHNAMQHMQSHSGMVHQQHMSQMQVNSPIMHHHGNQMSHHHQVMQQPQHDQVNQHHMHHGVGKEEEDDVDSDGFPLEFGTTGQESLPSMFDSGNNDIGMHNYLNHVGPDAMHLF